MSCCNSILHFYSPREFNLPVKVKLHLLCSEHAGRHSLLARLPLVSTSIFPCIGEVWRWGSSPEILKFPQGFHRWSSLMWESGHKMLGSTKGASALSMKHKYIRPVLGILKICSKTKLLGSLQSHDYPSILISAVLIKRLLRLVKFTLVLCNFRHPLLTH